VPDPTGISRWSTAPFVEWSGPTTELSRPLAVLVEVGGGPLDLIAADSDVTTFLNDGFHPWFVSPEAVEGITTGITLFLDLEGCLLIPAAKVHSAKEWLDLANSALVAQERHASLGALQPSPQWAFDLPSNHPLFASCDS